MLFFGQTISGESGLPSSGQGGSIPDRSEVIHFIRTSNAGDRAYLWVTPRIRVIKCDQDGVCRTLLIWQKSPPVSIYPLWFSVVKLERTGSVFIHLICNIANPIRSA